METCLSRWTLNTRWSLAVQYQFLVKTKADREKGARVAGQPTHPPAGDDALPTLRHKIISRLMKVLTRRDFC